MLQRIDEQLKPLVSQLERVKNLPAPEFGSLQSWERADIGPFRNGCPGGAESSTNSTLVTKRGNPDFEITLNDDVDGEDYPVKNDTGPKVMPPWMIKEGMNLTKEQRGEIPSKPDEISENKDDNKQKSEDEKSIEDHYIKAYYKAWRKQQEKDAKGRMQHEGEIFISDSSSDRKVGNKYKVKDEDEGIEREEVQFAGTTVEANKLEAQECGDEDHYEWVDG